MRRRIVCTFAVTQLGMPDFVSHQECLLERRPTVFMKNQWNFTVEGRTPTIENGCSGSASFYGYTEFVGDCDRELIGGPGVEPALDCLVVQPLGMLSSELYSVHGYSQLSSVDRVASSTPASLRIRSNDTFSAAVGLSLDLFARSWETCGGKAR